MVTYQEYQKARKKYNPLKSGIPLKILFVAESPPKSGKFFYFEEWAPGPGLFANMMKAIFKEEEYLRQEKLRTRRNLLEKFKKKGYYLIDASDYPINGKTPKQKRDAIRKNADKKINEIRGLCNKKTQIVLICKTTVHRVLYPKLRNEFHTHPKGLPFPSWGGQEDFRDALNEVLKCLVKKSKNST